MSILRLRSLVSISNSTDPTYDNPPAATWSSVEINVAIICSCLPLLRPLMTRFLPGMFSSHKRGNSTAPRTYATIGASKHSRIRKGTSSDDTDDLELTRNSYPTNENGGRDIRCITDIHVTVEGDSKRNSQWNSTPAKPEWAEEKLHKSTKASNDRASSTETLVRDKEVGRNVV